MIIAPPIPRAIESLSRPAAAEVLLGDASPFTNADFGVGEAPSRR